MSIALTPPTPRLFDSWSQAVVEFDDDHIDGTGMGDGTAPDRAAAQSVVEMAELYRTPGAELPPGHVPCDYSWITDGDEVVGFLAFRRELNDWLRQFGGHIGYAVRPSRRREGIASTALRLALDRARSEGYDRVLLTCDDDNPGSFRTIEGAGGVLENVIDAADAGHPRLRRYWIDL